MVPWWGLPIAMVAGVFIGILIIALMAANEK